jgi:4-amino-4-deoxy-L-arabinose transferase-like glycosyltransferase
MSEPSATRFWSTVWTVNRSIAGAATTAVLIVVLALALGSMRLDSTTSDEPAHIAGGVVKLQDGRLDFFPTNPPLWNVITAIPLVWDGVRMPPIYRPDTRMWAVGRYILYRTGHDPHRLLFLARLPTVAAFLALCLAVTWFVAHETGSRTWGLAGLLLTAFCPLIMAHGRLATVDVPLALFLFLSIALLVRLIERPSMPVAIGLGAASAAAILTKTSGNILAVLFVVLIGLAFLLRKIAQPRRFFGHFAVAAATGIVVGEIVIAGLAGPAYVREKHPQLESPAARLALPFVEAAANVRAVRALVQKGHEFPQFFLGEQRSTSWPHYYLVAVLLKTTIPALLVAIVGIVAFARRLPERGAAGKADPRFAAAACFVFAAAYFAAASMGQLAVGVRYVLPIYPAVYAGALIAIHTRWRDSAALRRRVAIGLAVLLTWHTAENLVAYPGYLAYFNEIAGGKANADRFLIDSNLDWGQDLRRLGIWARANGVSSLTIHYFGGGDLAADLPGIRATAIAGPGLAALPPGWFAVSRHFYRLSLSGRLWPMDYETYLERTGARYVTTVGDSILVYQVR